MNDEALANCLRVVGEPREEPYGVKPTTGDPDSPRYKCQAPEEKQDYAERQEIHRHCVPVSDPEAKLSTEEEQFIALVKGHGSTKGYLSVSNVPLERFMVPIVDTKAQIGDLANLVRLLFGKFTVSIVYPKRRSSINYDWRYTFSYLFRALGVEPDDGIPIIMLCVSSKKRIVWDFPALTTEETCSFELTLNYWCKYHLESMQSQLFRQIYYMVCCAFKSRDMKKITLYRNNGSHGELAVITTLIRNYVPEDSVDPSLLSSFPVLAVTTLFFGNDSNAMIN